MTLLHGIRRMFLRPLREGGIAATLAHGPRFVRDLLRYRRESHEKIRLADLYPCLHDATATTPFDPHYFYQSAWMARKIADMRPGRHVDIASQINLIAPLSAFVELEFVDLRPLETSLSRLTSRKGSILALPYADRSVPSLSCLHVIEHIGLGRYGDQLNPRGTMEGCGELQRVLGPGGQLYLSTPIGTERVEFNAHRIHRPQTILDYCGELKLNDFSCVDDTGVFYEHVLPTDWEGLRYGLGLFHFERSR